MLNVIDISLAFAQLALSAIFDVVLILVKGNDLFAAEFFVNTFKLDFRHQLHQVLIIFKLLEPGISILTLVTLLCLSDPLIVTLSATDIDLALFAICWIVREEADISTDSTVEHLHARPELITIDYQISRQRQLLRRSLYIFYWTNNLYYFKGHHLRHRK